MKLLQVARLAGYPVTDSESKEFAEVDIPQGYEIVPVGEKVGLKAKHYNTTAKWADVGPSWSEQVVTKSWDPCVRLIPPGRCIADFAIEAGYTDDWGDLWQHVSLPEGWEVVPVGQSTPKGTRYLQGHGIWGPPTGCAEPPMRANNTVAIRPKLKETAKAKHLYQAAVDAGYKMSGKAPEYLSFLRQTEMPEGYEVVPVGDNPPLVDGMEANGTHKVCPLSVRLQKGPVAEYERVFLRPIRKNILTEALRLGYKPDKTAYSSTYIQILEKMSLPEEYEVCQLGEVTTSHFITDTGKIIKVWDTKDEGTEWISETNLVRLRKRPNLYAVASTVGYSFSRRAATSIEAMKEMYVPSGYKVVKPGSREKTNLYFSDDTHQFKPLSGAVETVQDVWNVRLAKIEDKTKTEIEKAEVTKTVEKTLKVEEAIPVPAGVGDQTINELKEIVKSNQDLLDEINQIRQQLKDLQTASSAAETAIKTLKVEDIRPKGTPILQPKEETAVSTNPCTEVTKEVNKDTSKTEEKTQSYPLYVPKYTIPSYSWSSTFGKEWEASYRKLLGLDPPDRREMREDNAFEFPDNWIPFALGLGALAIFVGSKRKAKEKALQGKIGGEGGGSGESISKSAHESGSSPSLADLEELPKLDYDVELEPIEDAEAVLIEA